MPRITEADLKKQIKNKSFSPVYLIYGSEQMFVKSYTKKLCEAVAGKNPSDFNYHTFSGDIDFQELAASLQIMPFMAERNCALLSGGLAKNIDDAFAEMGKRFAFGGQEATDQRIYYINTKELPGNKYGTPSPVPFRVAGDRSLPEEVQAMQPACQAVVSDRSAPADKPGADRESLP